VSYDKDNSKWRVQKWSSKEKKQVFNGLYDDEKTAAHASDTLARKLIENGELNHKLHFPDDHTDVYPEEKTSHYIGVTYNKNLSKWYAQRWSRNDKKKFSNGYYDNAETAARASDNLARKLIENGGQKLKLNFPDDCTEIYPEKNQKKRKRPKDLNLELSQNN